MTGTKDAELEIARARAHAHLFPATTTDISRRYSVLETVGRGAMGIVYAAWDAQLERRVALKLVGLERGIADASAQRRLVREAKTLARLSHPNVVVVHDAGPTSALGMGNEGAFIAMEFVTGVPLRDWANEAKRSPREVLDVLLQAGRGLTAVHRAGLVHRDVKPDNLMIDRDGRVRLMDFGLARTGEDTPEHPSTSSATGRMTASTTIGGTLGYMAPELLEGGTADALSDQYAFAVTAWELLYGARPYAAESVMRLLEVIERGPTALSDARVPAWLQRVAARGLERDAARRFPSLDAMVAALQADPSRRRRRIAMFTSVAVTTIGVVVGVQVDHARTRKACADEGDTIEEIWNADVRAALDANVAPGRAATQAFIRDRLAPAIDVKAEAWRDARTRTCTAAAFAERSASLTLRADECLELVRGELARDLARATEPGYLTANAYVLLTRLPDVVPCEDDAQLMLQAPPAPEDKREEARSLRADLDGALRWETPEALADAIEVVTRVRSRADELKLVALQIHARDRLGYLLVRAGRAREAADAFEDAVETAFALGMEVLALDSLARLVTVAGGKLGQFQRARAWARVGKALAGRIDPGSEAEAEMWNASGTALMREEAFAEAATELLRADAMYATLHPEHPARVRTLQNIAWVQVVSVGPEAALRTHDRVIALAETLYGTTHPTLATALSNRAEIRIKANDPSGALVDLRRCVAIIEAEEGPRSPNLAMPWGGIALAELGLGHLDEAKSAIDTAFAVDFDKDAIELGGMLGRRAEIAFVRGDLEDARADYKRSIAVRTERLGPASKEVRNASEQLAWVETERGDLVAARALVAAMAAEPPAVENTSELPLLQAALARLSGDTAGAEAALARARASAAADESAVAVEASAIALAAGDPERALQEAAAARPAAAPKPYAFDAQLDLATCRAATALGRLKEAREACTRALTEARSTAPEHPRVTEILLATAQLESADGNFDRGRELAAHALDVRRRAGQVGIRIAEAERVLARAARRQTSAR